MFARVLIYFSAALLLLLPSPVTAADSVTLDFSEKGRIDLSTRLDIFIDDSSAYSLSDIIAQGDRKDLFISYQGTHPNLGILRVPVWVRFRLVNPGNVQNLFLTVNYPILDEVSLFRPETGGSYTELKAGEGASDPDVAFPYRRFVFALPVEPGSDNYYYMRIYSPLSAMTILLTLWQLEGFIGYERKILILYGLLFGAALFFFVHFIKIGIRLGEPAEFWFSIYLAAFTILIAIRSGFIQTAVGPLPVVIYNIVDLASISLVMFSGIKLLRVFLHTERLSVRTDRTLQVLQYLTFLIVPGTFGPLVFKVFIGLVLFLFAPVYSSYISFRSWLKGNKRAKYFVIGWVAANTAAIIDFLRIVGVIPWSGIMYFILPIACAWSLYFYTDAIIYRMGVYKTYSRKDSLTNLTNRYHFDRFLAKELSRNQRKATPLSLIMLDVDHFKALNDNHGHQYGDRCLIDIASALQKHGSRPGDLTARLGGEEFAVILSETGITGARHVAKRIQEEIRNMGIRRDDSYGTFVTVSMGIASIVPFQATNRHSLIKDADRALYYAKSTGRNRIQIFSEIT